MLEKVVCGELEHGDPSIGRVIEHMVMRAWIRAANMEKESNTRVFIEGELANLSGEGETQRQFLST